MRARRGLRWLGAAAVAAATFPAGATASTNLGTAGDFTYMRNFGAGPIVSVKCPIGTQVVSGGANAGSGRHVTVAVPFDSGDPGTKPDDGWKMKVRRKQSTSFPVDAVCESGEAAPDYVTKTSHIRPDSVKTLKAACPSGDRVTGGGAGATGPITHLAIRAIGPYDGKDADTDADDGWRVNYSNTSGKRQTLTLYAICTTAPRQYQTTPTGSLPPGSYTTSTPCSTPSQAMAAGGAWFHPAANVVLGGFHPADGSDPDSTPDDYWTILSTFKQAAKQTAYSICG